MKRMYMKPELKAVVIKSNHALLAGSVTLGVASGTLNANDALGREYDLEDEE